MSSLYSSNFNECSEGFTSPGVSLPQFLTQGLVKQLLSCGYKVGDACKCASYPRKPFINFVRGLFGVEPVKVEFVIKITSKTTFIYVVKP